MTDLQHRYLVFGRDLDPASPWVVGDVVDVYPVLETIDEFVTDAIEARAALDDHDVVAVDSVAFARGAAVMLASMNPRPRIQSQHGCGCSRRKGRSTPLVEAYALKGGVWVWVRGYRIPKAARRNTADLHEADTVWPVNALPHPWVTRCPHCRAYWGVLLTNTGYQLVRLGTPKFGVRVKV